MNDIITTPAVPSHPGETLKATIENHGQSVASAARILGMSRQFLHRVIAGKRSITVETAMRLEAANWGSAEFWMARQAGHDIARARAEKAA